MGITGDFLAVRVDADELAVGIWPERFPLLNAIAKSRAGAELYPDDLVIGADTVIELGGHLIGKPCDLDDARRILRKLSGRSHLVTTGICLTCLSRNIRCQFSVSTTVKFKELSDRVINDYLDKVYVLDKAGAYGIQEYGDMLTESVDGPLDNVIGLPCEKLAEALTACGFAY